MSGFFILSFLPKQRDPSRISLAIPRALDPPSIRTITIIKRPPQAGPGGFPRMVSRRGEIDKAESATLLNTSQVQPFDVSAVKLVFWDVSGGEAVRATGGLAYRDPAARSWGQPWPRHITSQSCLVASRGTLSRAHQDLEPGPYRGSALRGSADGYRASSHDQGPRRSANWDRGRSVVSRRISPRSIRLLAGMAIWALSGIVNLTRGYDTRRKTRPVFMGDQQ
jgi:hypothetical protein